MSDKETPKWRTVLRWVGLPICVVLGWLAVYALAILIFNWSVGRVYTGNVRESSVLQFINGVIASGVSVYFSCKIGIHMAPNHKRQAGIIICIFFIVMGAISIAVSLMIYEPVYFTAIVSAIVAIITASAILIIGPEDLLDE